MAQNLNSIRIKKEKSREDGFMLIDRCKRNSIFLSFLAIVGLTVFSFMGCGGGGGGDSSPTPTPAPTPTPQRSAKIAVSLPQIAFGDAFLNKFSDQTISIQNTGSSNLNIGAIAQANPLSAPFSILNDNCSGAQMTPSQTCTLQVRFSPTSRGGFNDSFDIPSNDPDRNSVTVSISGSGRALGVAINKVVIDSCPLVKVFVTATDADANPLPDLLQSNFSLFENGVLKPVISSSINNLPISVAMLIDYSRSVKDVGSDIQVAAGRFVGQLSNNDEAAIIKFATPVNLVQAFTSDKNALTTAINSSFGDDISETHLYDAIWSAIDLTATRPNRGAIVVISDGRDDNSTSTGPGSVKTLNEVIAHAIEKGINIFTIGLGDVDVGVMNQLAGETGGQYLFAPASSQLNVIYGQMSEIIFGQYVVEYNSSSSGSSPVTLDVVVDYNNLQEEASTNFKGCP